MSIPAYPPRSYPDIIITSREPRTRKYHVYEQKEVRFRVPVDRGDPTVWECPQVNVLKPDGTTQPLTGEAITSPIAGTFAVVIPFDILGYWYVTFIYMPQNTQIVNHHTVRIRVVQ